MAIHRAIVCAALLSLAITAAGGTSVKNKGDVHAKQYQWQDAGNSAGWNKGPVNQQSSNQAVQQAGNGNSAGNYNQQSNEGRKLLGGYYWIDNSGDVWAKQGQYQSSGNYASGNSGPVNQQSSNQAVQQAGNGNSAGNYNQQTIKGPEPPKPPQPPHQGRKLLGDWYWIDNSGDVWAKQKQYQSAGNGAFGNKGPVNQQSSNQAVQQAGNGNSAENYNQQKIKGRKLLGGDSYWIDNSGDVWAKQGQFQSAGNSAYYNHGPVNQQSSNQAIQQAGNGNSATNGNQQTIKGPEPPKPKGRRLQGWYWIDNSGDVWAKQSQYQDSGNVAYGNKGPVNQQSSNQAIQQAGNGNSAENYNKQTIKG